MNKLSLSLFPFFFAATFPPGKLYGDALGVRICTYLYNSSVLLVVIIVIVVCFVFTSFSTRLRFFFPVLKNRNFFCEDAQWIELMNIFLRDWWWSESRTQNWANNYHIHPKVFKFLFHLQLNGAERGWQRTTPLKICNKPSKAGWWAQIMVFWLRKSIKRNSDELMT